MFYKILYSETKKHICDDRTPREGAALPIYRHDVKTYIEMLEESGKHKQIYIKFCPCCGCELSKDATNCEIVLKSW